MVDFVFNKALGLGEKSRREFCKPDSDPNQFRLGSSIQKKIKFLLSHECITKGKIQNRLYLKIQESHKKNNLCKKIIVGSI